MGRITSDVVRGMGGSVRGWGDSYFRARTCGREDGHSYFRAKTRGNIWRSGRVELKQGENMRNRGIANGCAVVIRCSRVTLAARRNLGGVLVKMFNINGRVKADPRWGSQIFSTIL